MKKKQVLFFSILCMSLTLAIFSFGVFAASQCNVVVENTIIFDTSNNPPLFSVEGTVTGCTQNVPKYTNNMPTTVLGTSPDPFWKWDIGDLTFIDVDSTIVYTFNIVNLEPTDQVKVTIAYSPNPNSKLAKAIYPEAGRLISCGSSSTITLSVKLKTGISYDNVFSEDNNFRVVIERVAV